MYTRHGAIARELRLSVDPRAITSYAFYAFHAFAFSLWVPCRAHGERANIDLSPFLVAKINTP
jgi:hypothetical protein